ncbi:hypothetical protein E2C01_102768 [Portunus trituberculatus]|uniref:Uncharacterized protein n=1 Tax=Portunus trituberculatus TaxID=210409 RepID=A0A5B7KDF8_PORTR|nr:hypothetical protein [Portunus trituberculatus]
MGRHKTSPPGVGGDLVGAGSGAGRGTSSLTTTCCWSPFPSLAVIRITNQC